MNRLLELNTCFILLSCFFFSCIKVVKLEGDLDTSTKLVVNARIENFFTTEDGLETKNIPGTSQCIVNLTRSIDFIEELKLADIANLQITNAEVFLTDGTKEEKLTLVKQSNNLIYKNKPTLLYDKYYYVSNTIMGENNKSYTLRIVWEGKTYEATTKIIDTAQVKKLRKIKFTLKNPSNLNETIASLEAESADLPSYKNYTLVSTSTNDDSRNNGFTTFYRSLTLTDMLDNGKVVPNLNIKKGYNIDQFQCPQVEDTDTEDTDTDNESTALKIGATGYPYYCEKKFRAGDTVVVKFSEVEEGVYNYFNTLSFSINSFSNPFAQPIKIISNIRCVSDPATQVVGVFQGLNSHARQIIITPRTR